MTFEEKMRRAAATAGILASVLGLLALTAEPVGHLARVLVALGLAASGASLWLKARGRSEQATNFASGLALALALTALAIIVAAGEFSVGHLMLGEPVAPPGPAPVLPHAPLALVLAATSVLALKQARRRAHFRLAALLGCAVIATAATALLLAILSTVTPFARTLQISLPAALSLLALGVGVLLAQPREKLLQILFSRTAPGDLARRLFYGVTVLPVVLMGLVVLAMQFRIIDSRDSFALAMLLLLAAGLAVALLASESAVGIDTGRAEAEASSLLLTARLQEQAAQLHETVARRTAELREANTQLRAAADSNARLALLAQHTTNGVIITGADGCIEWVNAAFQKTSGYSLEEIKGRKPGSFLQGPDTDPATVARLHDAVHSGTACNVEILNYTKSGQSYWLAIDLQPVRDEHGRVINYLSVQTDITAQREVTERLRQLNERLALATQTAALGVWEWDTHTRQSTWDDRTLAIYGLTRDQFQGTPANWSDRLVEEDRAPAAAQVQRLIAGAHEIDQTFRIHRLNDGELRHVRSRAVAHRDATGQLLRIIGTERDITAEVEAVRQIETLNERLRLALRSSNYGVWELDVATQRLTWDDRMLELFGLTHAEFDGSRTQAHSRVHPDDLAHVRANIDRAIADETATYDTEFRVHHADGSTRHIETHGYVQRDAQGRPLRLVGLNRDITADKKLQSALELAEQRWQLALESTNDGVWDWDMSTATLFHDEQWARMLGYEVGTVSTDFESWRRLVHTADLASCEAVARDHFEGRTAFYQHEHRMLAKSGEWRWILDRGKVVTRSPDGRPLRMVGTHTDITARKELEERLRRTEALSEQVSSIAAIGGWEFNLETAQITWTEGAFRIHEVESRRQPTFEEALSFFPDDARDTLRATLHLRTLHEPNFDHELPLITAKGKHIWVRVLGRAQFRENQPVLVQGAIQDVTARHESEETRRALEGQLFQAQKMETLGTLAGGIAHDFNNLLTGIIGYHELAADSVPEDHPARACLTEARNASLRARELVEQILTFGRHSAGGGLVALDLGLVVEEARRFLRATLPANVVIELRIDPHTPHVLGDATQIHQVLLNLGSNAAHAMRPGGGLLTLQVEPTEVTPDLAQSLGGPAAGCYVRISVTDTGHGMDEATRRRIFDPFFTTKNTREGTGLGLAVVHGIVRAHRGAIDVDSSPGAGSTFHIYIPAATDERHDERPNYGAVPRGTGEFICIVDDEEIVGSCTKLVLESKGYRAVVYASAEQCIQAMSADPQGCALLVTDQTMPGMQGTELVAMLRKTQPRLPVVIMSGYFSKIAPHVLDELGQVELLAKPFTTDELTQAAHRALHPETMPG